MKKIFQTIAITFTAVMLSVAIHAQAPPPLPLNDDEDPDIPLDGGLSILLAAGLGYGAKKTYDMRKKRGKEVE